jgi:precorrin-8X/cobalt-precorrin-8 methylmutase
VSVAARLFDRYVFVDWSASAKPNRGKDSIWFAAGSASGTSAPRNPETRDRATDELRALLLRAMARGERVLLGFDFAYGYPAGFAAALDLPGNDAPWRRTWTLLRESIEDGVDNSNARFDYAVGLNRRIGSPPGPFWGHPPGFSDDALTWRVSFPFATANGLVLGALRNTDRQLRSVNRTVLPVWKLAGQGAVGSQTLLGIPRVAALRDDPALAPFSRVWPFETGFGADCIRRERPLVIHAEIWPGVLDPDPHGHAVPDARQVLALARWARGCDQRGQLDREFRAPGSLTPGALKECLEEEGWILGATTAKLRPL